MPSKSTLTIVVALAATASVLAAPAPYKYDGDLVERDLGDFEDLDARAYYDLGFDDLEARDDTVDASQAQPVHHWHHHRRHPRVEQPLNPRELVDDYEELLARDDTVDASQAQPVHHWHHHRRHPRVEQPLSPREFVDDYEELLARDDTVDASQAQPVHHWHHHRRHPRVEQPLSPREFDGEDLEARSLLSLFGVHHETELSTGETSRLDGMKKDCEALTDKKSIKKCKHAVKKMRGLEKRLKYQAQQWKSLTNKPLPPHVHSGSSSSGSSSSSASSSSPSDPSNSPSTPPPAAGSN